MSLSIKTLNIIVLDQSENVIEWLDSNKIDIVETNRIDTVRTIEMTVPLEDGYAKEEPWFTQGNKIYVPSTLGITSCLYVINTSYSVDYLNKNTVNVYAEEVLTELNYEVIDLLPESPLTVNKTNLETWFGEYYTIGEIDDLDSSKNKINPYETLTLMDLYRMIEEKTGYIFVTEYTSNRNEIERILHLKREDNIRTVARTEFLDLNRNLKSLELDVSEEDTFTAMAPLLSRQDSTIQIQSGSLENVNSFNTIRESMTGNDLTTSKEDLATVVENWKNQEVEYREYIPMICEKQQDGSINYTAYWYAPFVKEKGELFIKIPNSTSANYGYVIPPYLKAGNIKINPKFKMGTTTTNETDPYAIYNVCANKLMKKLRPVFKLRVDVEDIQDILGIDSLGYSLYETLYVRPPRFTYYVPCYITETKKNPHAAGSNTITIETDITGFNELEETMILSNNVITPAQEKNTTIGGTLISNEMGLPNSLVSINIRLDTSYSKIDYTTQQTVLPFKPETDYYSFTEEEIQSLEKRMHKDLATKKKMSDYYTMRNIDGTLYAVPLRWAESIYNSRNQHYIDSDEAGLNTAKFLKSIPVHYYPDNENLLKEKVIIEYFPSYFYDFYDKIISFYNSKGIVLEYLPPVVSSEHQNGPYCVPASVSNISSYLREYKTEGEMKEIFNTTEEGTTYPNIIEGLKKLNYNYSIVDFTKENIVKYILQSDRSVALCVVDARQLNYNINSNHIEQHAVAIIDWYYTNGISNLQCRVLDSNRPYFDPRLVGKFDDSVSFFSADSLINAVTIEYRNGNLVTRTTGHPVMIVIRPREEEYDDEEEIDSNFQPNVRTYTFDYSKLEGAITELLDIIKLNRFVDYFAETVPITSTEGITYKVNGKWILSMAYEYMYYYRNHYDFNNGLQVKAGISETSGKYYQHMETDYNWYSPCYPEEVSKLLKYVVATILFHSGCLSSPSEVSITADTYSSISSEIRRLSNSSINSFTVSVTKENVIRYLKYANSRSYGFYNVQIVIKLKSTDIDNYIQATYPTSYSNRTKNYYFCSLSKYNELSDKIRYVILEGNGNSITNRYDETYSAPQNPYRTIDLDTLLEWNANLTNGESGQMMVVSMFTQNEIEGWG